MLHQNVPAEPTSVENVEDTSSQSTATKQETPPTVVRIKVLRVGFLCKKLDQYE